LVKVGSNGPALDEVAKRYGAKVVDKSDKSVVVELVAESDEISALLSDLQPFGVKELVQSGAIALERGVKTLTDRVRDEQGLSNPDEGKIAESATADYQN
jgi:acetolactate synthase-1/3 small subunit